MKKLGLIGLLSLGLFVVVEAKPRSMQASEQYRSQEISTVEPFHSLLVEGQTEVLFKQAPEGTYTVGIAGPENLVELVNVQSKDHVLSISYKEPLLVMGDHHVKVSVAAPMLQSIRVQESGEVKTLGHLTADNLKVFVNGKGEIDFDTVQAASMQAELSGEGEIEVNHLICQHLQVLASNTASFDAQRLECDSVQAQASNRADITLSGVKGGIIQAESHHSAEMELKGNTQTASLTARGRSEVDAGALQAANADVIAENSAKVEVRVSETLNAETQGRGKVEYKGWPQQLNRTGKGNVYQNR